MGWVRVGGVMTGHNRGGDARLPSQAGQPSHHHHTLTRHLMSSHFYCLFSVVWESHRKRKHFGKEKEREGDFQKDI